MKYRCGMSESQHKEKPGREGGGSFPSSHVNWEIEWMLIKVVYQDSNLFCD